MRKVLFVVIAISFTACDEVWDCIEGEGPVIARELLLNDISSLELSGDDEVIISQGETQEVVVEGQQNIINRLNTTVNSGYWNIRLRDCVRRHEKLTFYITVPELKEIKVSGSGQIFIEDVVASSSLKLEIRGSGGISGAVNVSYLALGISGSGNISLSGETPEASLQISGSGDLEAFSLKVKSYDVNIAGSGNADITATESLKVNIAGSGSVYYKGNPTINSTINGSGKVRNLN